MPMDANFVTATPNGFISAGAPFKVNGVNCYFLAYCSESSRQTMMDLTRAIGANTIRSWGFLNVENRNQGDVAFQYLSGGKITVDTGVDGLERLDALIASAEANDIRLILPLVNYWNDLGGMPLYLKWLGIDGGADQFYRAPLARTAYQNWVRSVITRRNTRTNRFYYEEPAILAWELANEPRCEVAGGRDLLLDWIGEMCGFVKSFDANHLLGVGDEGYLRRASTRDPMYDGRHGVDAEAFLNFGEIDFGTIHFYPESTGKPPAFLSTWLQELAGSGRRANKPMLLEEFGIKLDMNTPDPAARRNQVYAEWLGAADQFGIAGDLLWMAGGTATDIAGFRDDYTIYTAGEIPAVAAHARSASSGVAPTT
jgi:mannan endo-1,4-beta-mannosidase